MPPRKPVINIKKKPVINKTETYKVINESKPGPVKKVTVEQVVPRFPGDPVPKHLVRTEIGEIPTLDISMKPVNRKAPKVVSNPDLIQPFARDQQIIDVIQDEDFLRKFALTRQEKPGSHNISELKAIAKRLEIPLNLSKEELIKAIEAVIEKHDIKLEED